MDPLTNIHPSILVHITEPETAKSIISSGEFKSLKNGIYGPGGYFSERETQGKICAHHHGAVVICLVNLGRICKVTKADLPMSPEELKSQNYDSIRGNFHTGPVYCVFDTKRVTPLFAAITESNISGVDETYYLMRTNDGPLRLGKIPLNNLIIKIKENEIDISDSDKPPFTSIAHKEPALGEREVIFAHRGDFHFENMDLFLDLYPSVLIHFCDPNSAKSIMATGKLEPAQSGIFGPGDYFAESDKNNKLEKMEDGAIVVCMITLGQMFKSESKTLPMKIEDLKSHHYDSIRVNSDGCYEYCVFDMTRVTPLFASIKEKGKNYFLIRNTNNNDPERLEKMSLENVVIKIKGNQVSISDNEKQPYVSITTSNSISTRREVMFVYKGDFHFEKVELFVDTHPSVLINLTDPKSARQIMESGEMTASKDGFYGPGGYFSECESHGKNKVVQASAILVCIVSLGKMFKAENKILPMTVDELKSQQYNSICGSFHTGPEYCVFDMNRVVPLFACITETNVSGVKETFYLFRTNNGLVRLEAIPLNELVIKIVHNVISISNGENDPFVSFNFDIIDCENKEVEFVHKGDFHFQKVEEIE